MVAASKAERWVGGSLVIVGALLVLACPGVLLYQFGWWLKDGVWSPVDCRLIWMALGGTEPAVAWLGVQKLLVSALDLPLSLAVLLLGCFSIISGAKIEKSS